VLLKEAINLVEDGVASPEDVDIIVRTTFGYRLPFFGPFAIADMAGLDTYAGGFATLERHYGERLAAPARLTELVESGNFGVKQGGGFVTPAGDQSELVAYRNRAYARLGQLLAELGPAPKGGASR
jgi:3-hydroxybutyryl-CoA dehydrogenase